MSRLSFHAVNKKGVVIYRRRELPQVSFLSQQKVFTTKKYACRDKTFVMTKLLSRQNYVCRDKIYLSRQKFGRDKYLSRQTRVCHYKSFVTTSIFLSWQNTCFVATTTCLSLEKSACRDKTFVATKLCLSRQKFCHDEHTFVATKTFLRQTHVRRDKTFVATKIILVAARASDRYSLNFHYTKLTRTVLLTVTTSSDRRSNGLTRVLALTDHPLVTATLQL